MDEEPLTQRVQTAQEAGGEQTERKLIEESDAGSSVNAAP